MRVLSQWAGIVVLCCSASVAMAHFVFIVPQPDGVRAQVVMSEELTPDPEVKVEIIAGTKLSVSQQQGKDIAVALKPGENFFVVDLPGSGTRVAHGLTDLGVNARGKGPAHLLLYHPKTIIGDAFNPQATLGNIPVELVPAGKPGALQFKLLIAGKPASADQEVTVILPDDSQKLVKTDASGLTPPFLHTGRYGAWARHWENKSGERDGKKYEQIRHYATLVVDVK